MTATIQHRSSPSTDRWIDLKVMCELTPEEIQARGLELAAAFVDRGKVDAARREAARGYVEQLKEIDGRMARLSESISTNREERFVRCAVVFHSPANGTKRTVRTDTGEIVREEQMTNTECQQFLFADAHVDPEVDATAVAECLAEGGAGISEQEDSAHV